MKILITGANGFIGTHLCDALSVAGHELLECVRNPTQSHHIATGDIASFPNWAALMQGVDCVIHLAAMVHQKNGNSEAEFDRANVTATQQLLEAAKQQNIAHFVFFSTIAVMGYAAATPLPATHIAPYSPYSRSKLAAEQLVQASNLPHSIIRIPLTYGAGVRANFASLIKAVQRGVPLPFGMVQNARSLLYVGNLCAYVVRLLELSPPSTIFKSEILLLSDRETPSTPQLIVQIAHALGVKPRLLPVPPLLLKVGALVVRKPMLYHQLCSSLVMDSTATYESLNWQPPFSLQQGLGASV